MAQDAPPVNVVAPKPVDVQFDAFREEFVEA